jgi:hypothetical protein
MLGIILVVILVLALLGALPRRPHSRVGDIIRAGEWGWSS